MSYFLWDYSIIAPMIYIILAGTGFITGSILFIILCKKTWQFWRPALFLVLVNFFIYIIKFCPGIFNYSGLEENIKDPGFIGYLFLIVMGIPYDFIKLFTFMTVGLVLFKSLEIIPLTEKCEWKTFKFWSEVLFTSLIFIAITEILIYIVKPVISEDGKKFLEIMMTVYTNRDFGSFHIAICAPFTEEPSYRFFYLAIFLWLLKNFRFRWIVAILLSSLVWTFGHTGSLNPEWMRFIQIFTYGLLLGWLFKRRGLEACIVSHLISNIVLTALHLHTEF
ncbi:MAG: Sporulation-killing factor biosynthesis protein SkfC [bacterium ADurb.Bin363]|nr:MAG: Sporulation-killing factor biosynthesis protein SkfC [bacterium ADurb.Bin363]